MEFLTEASKVSTAITPTAGAAGTTAIEGSVCDMAGYDGVKMQVRFGAIVTNAATSIKAQQGALADMSDAADLEGTSQTVADDDDGEFFVIDITQPTKRYVRVYVARATQNATVAEAHYAQYRKATSPVTAQGTGVNLERFNAPAEGTA